MAQQTKQEYVEAIRSRYEKSGLEGKQPSNYFLHSEGEQATVNP
jgi:hypothetical protein